MISFYLLWTLCYLVLLWWIAKKWPNQVQRADFKGDLPQVTLLIPFRNEIENLPVLLEEFPKLNYPNLEIILVDDQSEDGSFSFLREKPGVDTRVKVLRSQKAGKKSAIEFGISCAVGEVIICSDADCKFPENWIHGMVAPFGDQNVQLVAGPVISESQDTFFQRFQQIDWSSILLLTQFYFSQKNPLMCSGANLAYRKSAFREVKGYGDNLQHLSGDDEFLLKKIKSRFGKRSCVYLPFSDNLVITKPQSDFSKLLNQRVRWAGKWNVHRDFGHAFAAILSFFIQVVWLGSWVLLGFGWFGVIAFSWVWVGKILAEKFALGKVLEGLGLNRSTLDFIRTSWIHPLYVLMVAMGSMRGKFLWKGRTN